MKKSIIPLIIVSIFYLQAKAQTSGKITFRNVAEEAGLIEPLKGMMGHGAAWGDVDGNGYPDLFYGTFCGRPDSVYAERGHPAKSEPDKLFLNNGDGTFTEVMDTPIRQRGRNSGAAFADFDNDGDLELVVSHNSYKGGTLVAETGNFLFENDGKGSFTDVTKKSNLDLGHPFTGRNTFVFDFDGDGLLDVFMQEDYLRMNASGGNSRLMKNMGNLVFKDVTKEAGFSTGYRKGLHGIGGWVGDINDDGWPDVFFAHSCRMFINNQNGTFHEKDYKMVYEKYRLPAGESGGFWSCGADLGDIDNDGDIDMVMGDHYPYSDTIVRTMYIFQNEGNDANGDPILTNITRKTGVPATTTRTPHVQLQDIDNDGMVDIMFASCEDFIFRNTGTVGGIPQFEGPISSGFVGGIGYWAAGPLGDYDRDGKLDFIGPDWEPAFVSPLLRNVTEGADNYLAVKLELKKGPNRNGIGARVDIYKPGKLGKEEGRIATRLITVSNGYSSGYEAIANFGLPNDEKVDVRVSMPCDGSVYKAKSVKRNQMYIIKK